MQYPAWGLGLAITSFRNAEQAHQTLPSRAHARETCAIGVSSLALKGIPLSLCLRACSTLPGHVQDQLLRLIKAANGSGHACHGHRDLPSVAVLPNLVCMQVRRLLKAGAQASFQGGCCYFDSVLKSYSLHAGARVAEGWGQGQLPGWLLVL